MAQNFKIQRWSLQVRNQVKERTKVKILTWAFGSIELINSREITLT